MKNTFEYLQLEASKYQRRSDFAKNSPAAYQAARKRADFEQICAHMEAPKTKAYTLEQIRTEAQKYASRSDFMKNSNSIYQAALKRKDYPQITAHMEPSKTKAMTLEEIQSIANKYTKRGFFKKGDSSAYNAAWRRPDFEQICAHMDRPENEPYTTEELLEIASQYKTRSELYNKNASAYGIIIKREDSEEILANMPKHVDQSGENNPMYGRTGENSPSYKWNLSSLKQESLKYVTRTEFFKNNTSAYLAAKKRQDYEEIVSHMIKCPSMPEKEIFEFVRSVYPQAHKMMDRSVSFKNKPHIHGFEIDIFIPELNKGIEFDGRYHHSPEGLKRSRPHWPEEDIRDYHELKDRWFASKGISLLHIKWYEWENDKESCINRCLEFISS